MQTGQPLPATCADDGVSEYLHARPRLFRIAYRMLGRASDAEDIVQDVWMRWQVVDRSVVRHAGAFLTTTTIRLAINFMQSARIAPGDLCRTVVV
jgi:DNA-directed RNA polymerase specialized sigma24 family protein